MEIPTLQNLTKVLTDPTSRVIPSRSVLLRKLSAGSILATSDLLFLATAVVISLVLRHTFWPGEVTVYRYITVFPIVLAIFPIAFYLRDLYPGFGIDIIEEMRTLTYSITIVFAILGSMTYFLQGEWEYSRIAFFMSWVLALVLVPLGRSIVRKLFGKKSWWGVPVVVIGAGNAGEKVIKSLQKNRQIGLRPIVAIDDNIDRWGYIDNIPVIGGLDVLPDLTKRLNVDHSIIAMPNVPRKRQQDIIQKYSKYFEHTTIIPNLFGTSSLWVSTRNIGGILGLEVQQRLLKTTAYLKKRVFDIVLASFLSLLALPLFLIISFMIFIDSKGRIFFRQERMGLGDSRFNIVKFRTMHVDAEERLSQLLKQNPELRKEYEVYHKMKQDPRLTRVGKILRKFSLDELPQFWNVIKGEMSLIGPRAYMPWEKYKMNGHDEMIHKVKPGISGLWQVTDRNQSSFEERLYTDVYYIRNWSMFMDLYILARTIAVVFLGRGAY